VSADDRAGATLVDLLLEARELGFLGPGAVEPHIAHARALCNALTDPPRRFLDLGSGGGLPGLVAALDWRAAVGVLLDASTRRTEFLRRACTALKLSDRVAVVCDRAEVAAHNPRHRFAFDAVLARSFGPPAVVAECAVGFLERGGALVVSDPPDPDADRWPAERLSDLGLELEATRGSQPRISTLRRIGEVDDRWPRRVGVPAKRPLWR
jgi:16S rRNA (guanine527-N7)-methyltransferase